MFVHRDLNNLPPFRNAIITIGTFDGVHMGHRQIINKMKEYAREADGETVIITFHPHPRKIVSSTILGIRLINTLDEKLELLASFGIDHTVVVPFTDAFANQEAEDYAIHFLEGKFKPHTVIIGYDHRFGRDRKGDYHLLEKRAAIAGYQIVEIPKHILQDISISSTRIREAILHGDISTANSLLGYSFFFSGKVVHGDKLGRELGYPTANLKPDDEEKIIPGDGIYTVMADLTENITPGKPAFKGMMSIGFRPTVDGKKRVIEVNLFDFNQDIYGKELRVYVVQFLRAEIRFDGLPALIRQIDNDKVASLEILSKL